MPQGTHRITVLAVCVAVCWMGSGCQKGPSETLYFGDLKAPILDGNPALELIKDENLNKSTGGEITIIAAVDSGIDRDELELLVKGYYRQAKGRTGFQKGGVPEKISIRVYATKAAAEAGGGDWLASLERISSVSEPTITNRQKPPLSKWAKRVMDSAMRVFTGAIKPAFVADVDAMSLEVTWPFVTDDGSGKYVEKLSFEKATTEFSSLSIGLFEKLDKLKKLTFVGKHNDKVMLRVWLTRAQFEELNIKNLEENLGRDQAQFMELVLGKQMSEKQWLKKTQAQRRKAYKELFSRLPKGQAVVDKSIL